MVGLVSHVRFLKFSIFASGTRSSRFGAQEHYIWSCTKNCQRVPTMSNQLTLTQGTNTNDTLWITDCRIILGITMESARSSPVVLTKHAVRVAYQFRRLVAKNKYVSLCVISA
jgi:hypothetical protein